MPELPEPTPPPVCFGGCHRPGRSGSYRVETLNRPSLGTTVIIHEPDCIGTAK